MANDEEDVSLPIINNSCNEINWNLCILCQETTEEKLQCPSNKKGINRDLVYDNLAKTLYDFNKIDSLEFDINRLDNGSGIKETLIYENASWHKTCKVKYNKTELVRANKRKRISLSTENEVSKKITRHSTNNSYPESKLQCFFCDGMLDKDYRRASTFELDKNVRKAAYMLNDENLISKLSTGDMIAQDALYHLKCLTSLYNRIRSLNNKNKENNNNFIHGIALAEIIEFIKETKANNTSSPIFKLSELSKKYQNYLKMLTGTNHDTHSTRLKERILNNVPELECRKEGRDMLLLFSEDIGTVLRNACESDCDSDAISLMKAAKLIRKDLKSVSYNFEGSFEVDCQKENIPKSLFTLTSTILNGTSLESNKETPDQHSLSLSQLLIFNTRDNAMTLTNTRHEKQNETPLAIYVGLLIYAKTRKRNLIDTFFQLGLSISYSRVLSISNELANRACSYFKHIECVCSPKMRKGLLVHGAADNIDHNPSSTTAKGSFHGTSISLFQQPTKLNPGTKSKFPDIHEVEFKCSMDLPNKYTEIQPVAMKEKFMEVPLINDPLMLKEFHCLDNAIQDEKRWQVFVKRSIETNKLEKLTWSAFHAEETQSKNYEPCISSLLPLFRDNSKSAAMIKHSMEIIRDATNYLNPKQTPIITLDQPLFSLAKQIQWTFPEALGESKYIVLLGGLHIEMCVLKCLGNWLENSGWTNVLVQAKLASPGVADSFLKASHVTRSRHAHQVTVCVLQILLENAYEKYKKTENNNLLTMEDWKIEKMKSIPMFHYWLLSQKFEMLYLVFVRSLREGNFILYQQSLIKLAHLIFALDHHNYARWLSIHIRDMMNLKNIHPDIYREFSSGFFVVNKTSNRFSGISIDQAHEQNNSIVKGEGGAIGLTENESALKRWTLSGPELCRVLNEFELTFKLSENVKLFQSHHEETKFAQTKFSEEVKSLLKCFEELGNPFLETCNELFILDSKLVVNDDVKETLKNIETVGEEKYKNFVKERFKEKSKSLYEPITKNALPLFSTPPKKILSKNQLQVKNLKNDRILFSQLYIACQNRDSDLDNFFEHENQIYPPSISHCGQIRTGNKADIVTCLEKICPSNIKTPKISALILDGSVIVHLLNPINCKTFAEYSIKVFQSYLLKQLHNIQRLDIVWDRYFPNSIKGMTRDLRGKGTRRKLSPTGILPKDWQNFLRCEENKTELFQYLAYSLKDMDIPKNKSIYSTYNDKVMLFGEGTAMPDCNHEESDTRIFVHVCHYLHSGHQNIMIRSVDSDVVVLAVSVAIRLSINLWIAYGKERHYRYLNISETASLLGESKSKALPAFHAFTGNDYISSFYGIGKKTAFDRWSVYPDVTSAFLSISSLPQELKDEDVKKFERYTILLYDRTSSRSNINEIRKDLYTKKLRDIEHIPPTKAALIEHIKRCAYISGYIWGQCIVSWIKLPNPSNWGYEYNNLVNKWQPFWTSLPDATKACQELKKCKCKAECQKRCLCKSLFLKCTALCQCGGECQWTKNT